MFFRCLADTTEQMFGGVRLYVILCALHHRGQFTKDYFRGCGFCPYNI